jgi:hypothetical protein
MKLVVRVLVILFMVAVEVVAMVAILVEIMTV